MCILIFVKKKKKKNIYDGKDLIWVQLLPLHAVTTPIVSYDLGQNCVVHLNGF